MLQHIFTTPISFHKWPHSTETTERIYNAAVNASSEGRTFYRDVTTTKNDDDDVVFRKWILETAQQHAWDVGYKQGVVVLRRAWMRVIRNPQNTVPLHYHPEAWCVGTFYFTDGGGDIMLVDPRGYIGEYEVGRVNDAEGKSHSVCNDYYYTPEKNTAIVFPGYLKHMVHSSSQNDERTRVAISWDIRLFLDDECIESCELEDDRYMRL